MILSFALARSLRISRLHFLLHNYAYRLGKDIDGKDRDDFYASVVLPLAGRPHGAFMKDVFDRGLRKLIELWRQMWQHWQAKISIGSLIPDWDLNTGKDRATGQLAFWS
jgi:hypothetical protein